MRSFYFQGANCLYSNLLPILFSFSKGKGKLPSSDFKSELPVIFFYFPAEVEGELPSVTTNVRE